MLWRSETRHIKLAELVLRAAPCRDFVQRLACALLHLFAESGPYAVNSLPYLARFWRARRQPRGVALADDGFDQADRPLLGLVPRFTGMLRKRPFQMPGKIRFGPISIPSSATSAPAVDPPGNS